MSPLLMLHVTRVACRDSILADGLIPAQPRRGRPFGVYVFSDHLRNRVTKSHSRDSRAKAWGDQHRRRFTDRLQQDVWQIAYLGPAIPDPYFENAMILLYPVEPEFVSLVTCN